MMKLELSFRKWAFYVAALSVAKLSILVVTPEEKGSILESHHAVASPASQLFYQERRLLFVLAIIQFRNVLY